MLRAYETALTVRKGEDAGSKTVPAANVCYVNAFLVSGA
jgi:hypothetical protein